MLFSFEFFSSLQWILSLRLRWTGIFNKHLSVKTSYFLRTTIRSILIVLFSSLFFFVFCFYVFYGRTEIITHIHHSETSKKWATSLASFSTTSFSHWLVITKSTVLIIYAVNIVFRDKKQYCPYSMNFLFDVFNFFFFFQMVADDLIISIKDWLVRPSSALR